MWQTPATYESRLCDDVSLEPRGIEIGLLSDNRLYLCTADNVGTDCTRYAVDLDGFLRVPGKTREDPEKERESGLVIGPPGRRLWERMMS